MKIEAYLLCWNERDIMPLVIKHYKKFCDKIIILDNYSTDGSDKLAQSLGCEVRKFGNRYFDDSENMKVKNECWKGSQADWVIVADFDEALQTYIPDIPRPFELTYFALKRAKESSKTIFKTQGWQIMSDKMPKHDLWDITNGYPFDNYSKSIIFNPKAITEMDYNPGAHRCDPKGNVVWSEETLYVLHYKHIGGIERTIKRYGEYRPRMSPINRKKGWGKHYDRSEHSLREEWAERIAKSKPLI